jgi:hypothetical protein
VVLATVILAAGDADRAIPDRRAFVRDASAYLVASLLTLCLLWAGRLTALDGALLLGGYVAYLALCLATRSGGGGGGASGSCQANDRQAAYRLGGLPGAGVGPGDTEMVPLTFASVDPGTPQAQLRCRPRRRSCVLKLPSSCLIFVGAKGETDARGLADYPQQRMQ